MGTVRKIIRAVAAFLIVGATTSGSGARAHDRYLLIGSPTRSPFVAFVDVDNLQRVIDGAQIWLIEIYQKPNPALTPPALYALIRFRIDCYANTDIINNIIAYADNDPGRLIDSDDKLSRIEPNTVVANVADIECKRVVFDDKGTFYSLEAARRLAKSYFDSLNAIPK